VSGIGASAFSVSKGGVVNGIYVLTSDNALIVLTTALPSGQIEQLATKLAGLY